MDTLNVGLASNFVQHPGDLLQTDPSSQTSWAMSETRNATMDAVVGTQVGTGPTKSPEASVMRRDAQDDESNDTFSEDADKATTHARSQMEQQSQKQSQVAQTLKWLTENYERAEGVCLPRCVLYTHYLDLCKKMKFTPAGAATFGKIIRQKFPKLTTRRLGTRGQSKYHYYGIGIKESSVYYHSVYSGKGLTRFSGIKIKTEGSSRKYSLSSKTGTLLPEFPESNNLILPAKVNQEKVHTFIMMYRTHCQRILDTVISANFDEVQNFLLHFWQGMPDHLVDLLSLEVITEVIGLCDSILYKVLIDVLIPSSIQDLPDSLCSEIKAFTRRLPAWLDNSLENVPQKLCRKKLDVVRWFVHSVRRQIAFVHLAQTTRSVLLNHDSIAQMIKDIGNVDLSSIFTQTAFTDAKFNKETQQIIRQFFEEFQGLLSKQAPIEAYTEWMDNVIDKCVLQICKLTGQSFKQVAAQFLLQWSIIGSLIMRDLTLHNASSFGSFHLLHMMFDEYVFLVMETQQSQVREQELQKAVKKFMKNAGEISMQSYVRASNRPQDKGKKRKHDYSDEHYDSNEEVETLNAADENRPHYLPGTYSHLNGTAFTRPPPITHGYRENSTAYSLPADELSRVNSLSNPPSTLGISPLKHYPALSSASFDRSNYLASQMAIQNYTDYANNSFSNSRMANYGETHNQGYPSFSPNLSIPTGPSPYWPDTRGHTSYSDPYGYHAYSKYPGSYDTYNKSHSLLASRSYQNTFNRYDTSRSFYGRAHDTFNGASLAVQPPTAYGANFMEIAPSGAQYPRQDTFLHHQADDFYSSNVPNALQSFNKGYVGTYR